MGHEIDVEEIIEPDEIIWENLAYTGSEQRIRQVFTLLFALFFVGFSVIFTLLTNGFSRFTASAKVFYTRDCAAAPESYTAWGAYVDTLKATAEDPSAQGLMGCYCQFHTKPFEVWKIYAHNFLD